MDGKNSVCRQTAWLSLSLSTLVGSNGWLYIMSSEKQKVWVTGCLHATTAALCSVQAKDILSCTKVSDWDFLI